MAKKAFVYFVVVFFFLLFKTDASAVGEFDISYDTTYVVHESGQATVEHKISLTNNQSKVYATSYTFLLEGKKPQSIRAIQDGESLPLELKQEGDKTEIFISFEDSVVGLGKTRVFSINYILSDVAMQNGNVWELTIPKLGSPETISNYSLTLSVPSSFGEAAYISPKPRSEVVEDERQTFLFLKDDLVKAGVVAAFGEFQVFSFTLSYHLQNPYATKGETEIALVPDTALQRVYYEYIEPKPEKVRLDEDGNWLATYILDPHEQLDVRARLNAQIFSTPQSSYPRIDPASRADYYLAETDYWQINNPAIRLLAGKLKTPRDIYDYVTNNLSYDYSRVDVGIERLGAVNILNNPERAVCMEFTDLFIALARANGIPAREINGYGYTEDPVLQPLSLVSDVLHAWPEYWDEERGYWRPVDPTWGKTTGGVDFFDKFDLAHTTFAIHGDSPLYPLPAGAYKSDDDPQKDVLVEFGTLPVASSSDLAIEVVPPKFNLPFLFAKYRVIVSNPGPNAVYNKTVELSGEDVVLDNFLHSRLEFLAPFDSREFNVLLKQPAFTVAEGVLAVRVGDYYQEYKIPLRGSLIAWITLAFSGLLILLGVGFATLFFGRRLLTLWRL